MLTKRAAMQMRSLQHAFVQTFPKIIRPPKSDRLLGFGKPRIGLRLVFFAAPMRVDAKFDRFVLFAGMSCCLKSK
jgi:hypothetical protein